MGTPCFCFKDLTSMIQRKLVRLIYPTIVLGMRMKRIRMWILRENVGDEGRYSCNMTLFFCEHGISYWLSELKRFDGKWEL